MTVEERAREVEEYVNHWRRSSAEMIVKIEQALRDQIEDCANVAVEEMDAYRQAFGQTAKEGKPAAGHLAKVAERIRALATNKRERFQ